MKSKVERSVGHVKNTRSKGCASKAWQKRKLCGSLGAALGQHAHSWHDQASVAAKFAEEKPSLKPLPLEPFRKYQFGDRRVNLDGCVEVETAYYSTPPG
jgi:hypothetical protein